MSIIVIVTCDSGKSIDCDKQFDWDCKFKKEAWDGAENQGWVKIKGKHICPECKTEKEMKNE